jgi:hypothetical protein
MAIAWPEPKDPDEVLDYELDWSGRLDGDDTIVTSTWTVPAGLTEGPDPDSVSDDGTKTVIWLSGGTLAANYDLLNRVVTAGGRTMDQTVRLKVRAK